MNTDFNYGGQAVMEGVMMRGPASMTVAVRNPQGEIVVHSQPINATLYQGWPSRLPVLRGLGMLWDALGLGTQALMWSADVALGEEESGAFQGALGWLTALVGIGIGVVLFMILPSLVVGFLPFTISPLLDSLLEGVVRLAIVVAYLWGVGRMPDVSRIFAYHGAEHKTINAYEDGAVLTPASVQSYSTVHTRCGTSFLLTVVVISILVFAPLGDLPLLWRLVSRVVALPLIAGLAYEWIRFAARHSRHSWVRWLVWPNLALQRLTTREPTDEMVEVAIRALQTVLREVDR